MPGETTAGTARLICRHCGDAVTAAATGPAPLTALGGDYLRPFAHQATGLELAPDGHAAAPLDPGMRGSVTAAKGKPSPGDLGIDLAAVEWGSSGGGDGHLEVAFPAGPWERGDWVLMRVAGDPGGRVLVYDRDEWLCFLDGARNGEFDDAAA
jgi:hypothetical protein